jgi:hypothetical protein
MIASASVSLSKDRLKTLPAEGHRQILHFLNKEKDVGQFECIIKYLPNPMSQSHAENGDKAVEGEFNPLISRILFTE